MFDTYIEVKADEPLDLQAYEPVDCQGDACKIDSTFLARLRQRRLRQSCPESPVVASQLASVLPFAG